MDDLAGDDDAVDEQELQRRQRAEAQAERRQQDSSRARDSHSLLSDR